MNDQGVLDVSGRGRVDNRGMLDVSGRGRVDNRDMLDVSERGRVDDRGVLNVSERGMLWSAHGHSTGVLGHSELVGARDGYRNMKLFGKTRAGRYTGRTL